jgi:endoglucanase
MISCCKSYFKLFLLVVIIVSCRNKTNTLENAVITQPGFGKETTIRKIENGFTYESGAIIRGDTTTKKIALVFTGDEFADGGEFIAEILNNKDIKGSFFFTGNFYRNAKFKPIINRLISNGNYLGSHSDKHLLYCDWVKRDSLLVSRPEFMNDIKDSYVEMGKFGIDQATSHFYLPPYEWYNDSISLWTNQMGLELVNFSPGTRSNADYTYPEMEEKYLDSKTILKSVLDYEKFSPIGLNGFILLVHIGTDPRRTDKFYSYLPDLIDTMINRGYQFVRIDDLLK